MKRKVRVMSVLSACLLCALVVLTMGSVAVAQTGVSDDRVSLPDGPGSLEGIGDNAEIDPNMGSMRHSLPIQVPQGFAGVTPQLQFAYSSTGGSGPLGVGWMMDLPFIERMTFRGLPEYDADDDFSMGGGQQLVRMPGTNPPVYRARYEKGFVRYTWHEVGDGAEGYWTAEYPDGRVGYFGATAAGELVATARVGADEGTFRYMLVEMVDVYGHAMRCTYEKFGEVALIRNIGYVFTRDPNTPRYSVSFQYQERMDDTGFDYLSDAKGGFNELLTQRLSAVNVFSGSERIRRYELEYERYDDSGGFTRLKSVQMLGLGGELFPVRHTFGYSQALGGVCGAEACSEPFVVEMGNIGVNIGVGRATLLDINGDSLPDVINTSDDGPHTFLLNIPTADGTSQFEQTVRTSATAGATGSGFRLGTPYVHVLDVNGDGFTDLIHAQTGRVLINRGQGDWEQALDATTDSISDIIGLDFDTEDGELRSVRFLDYDNDRRIDLIRATRTETRIMRNTPDGFENDPDVEPLGYGIFTDGIDFADMNGDGLLDAVKLNVNGLRYKLNYGRGRWGDEVEVLGLPIEESELDLASLEDLNGDGLSDLVVVAGSRVKYAINRNGVEFTDITILEGDDVNGALPTRDATVTVAYADMNASGSSDIVWLTSQGDVAYLELFPVRPNLLSRLENAIGHVTEVTYGTSVSHMARDGGWETWEHRLPNPMLVVDKIDHYNLLTDIHEVTEYRYHDGFYDGIEKQFRGYARVEVSFGGDATQEEGLTRLAFDVGATDPYRNGLPLEKATLSNGRPLFVQRFTHEDCPVADVPEGTALPVRHVCQTATAQVLQEGADPSEWVTVESFTEYDGYGNIALQSEQGVTSIGGAGCAPCERGEEVFGQPCGAQCLGDEMYSETEYVQPGADTSGRWIVSAPFRQTTYGRPGDGLQTEVLTYYDGDAFVGMGLGTLDQGKITRVTEKVDGTRVIEQARYRYDVHGNVIEQIAPNGAVDGQSHRRRYVMDDDKLRVVQLNIVTDTRDGQLYELQRDIAYEPTFDKIVNNTTAMRVVNGEVVSSRRSTAYTYDAFGRQISEILAGGDTVESPTRRFSYELGSPVSRIVAEQRSEIGGEYDLDLIRCLDGQGRLYQSRQSLGNGQYQVSGFIVYNTQSSPRRVYQPYIGASDQCDTEPPADVLFTDYTYDAIDRALTRIHPDGAIYGEASVSRTVYAPLKQILFDVEDTDPSSPHHDTPTTTISDGMGRRVVVERLLTPGGEPARTEAHFDGLGRMTGYTDAQGNTKTQRFDLLGRLLEIDDPNMRGSQRYTYDDNGNVIATVDPRGVEVQYRYDSYDRVVERFDAADPQGTRVTWTFDAAPDCPANVCTNLEGLVAEITYPGVDGEVARDRFGYDIRSRRILHKRALAGAEFDFGFGYDNANRLVQTTYPNGQALEWVHDAASRLAGIDGVVEAIAYDDRGQPTTVTYSDGSSRVVSYDALQRLEQDATVSPSGDVLQGWAFQYDRRGNRLEVEDLSDAPAHLSASMTAQYDAWYRTTRVQYTATDEVQTTAFDTIDNITERTFDGATPNTQPFRYNPDAPNALVEAGGVTYAYDAAGNVSARGDLSLTWDHRGRMTQADDASGAAVLKLTYGYGAERLVKREGDSTTLYLGPSFEVRDGISTLYPRFGSQRVARLEDDSLATTLYSDLAVAGDTPDGQINAADAWLAQGAVEVEGEPSDVGALLMASARRMHADAAPDITHLHHNHLGSVTLATADGQVVGQRSFNDLGEERANSGYVDVYGFSGQELDASTGLIGFMWRLYDPKVGRWMSIDPLFAKSSPETFSAIDEATTGYAYVGNNFVNMNDPFGLNKGDTAKGNTGGDGTKGNAKGKAKGATNNGKKLKPKPKNAYGVKLKSDSVETLTGDAANDYMDKNFNNQDPFPKGKKSVFRGKLAKDTLFIRVHGSGKNAHKGKYFTLPGSMLKKLREGTITTTDIQQELAVENAPTHYTLIVLGAGTDVMVGEIGPQKDWKDNSGKSVKGGGIQAINLQMGKVKASNGTMRFPTPEESGIKFMSDQFPIQTADQGK